MRIFIIIPANNEENTLGALVRTCVSKGYEVIVIDDGSTDNSSDVASSAGATVIINETRQGKGWSLRKGFELAIEKGCDGVVTLDGDGQHDVDDLEGFMAQANDGAHLVVGNRMNAHEGMPVIRFFTNRLMSFIISIACKQHVPDTQCGYRYIRREVLQEIDLSSRDFEIETEILMKAAKKGFSIGSVDIKTIYRDEESKINPIKDTLRFISYFAKEIFSKK